MVLMKALMGRDDSVFAKMVSHDLIPQNPEETPSQHWIPPASQSRIPPTIQQQEALVAAAFAGAKPRKKESTK